MQQLAREELVQKAEEEQEGRADQRDQSEHRMEQEHDAEIEWHPGRIEECERAWPGQELPKAVEVAQRLRTLPAKPSDRALEDDRKDPWI